MLNVAGYGLKCQAVTAVVPHLNSCMKNRLFFQSVQSGIQVVSILVPRQMRLQMKKCIKYKTKIYRKAK
jgi:hypothetical protein